MLLCCLTIVLASPWLRSYVDLKPLYGGGFEPIDWVSQFLPNFIYDPIEDYHGAQALLPNVLGFFLIGQFPLLPWLVFPLIGFVLGKRVVEGRFAEDVPFLVIIGLMFSFFGVLTAYAGSLRTILSVESDYIVPLSFYPLSFSMNMLLIGVVLLLYVLLWYVYDARAAIPARSGGLFLAYCRQISKYSLTIYITHFALFFIPLRVVEAVTGVNYLKNLMDTPSALLCSAVSCCCCCIIPCSNSGIRPRGATVSSGCWPNS